MVLEPFAHFYDSESKEILFSLIQFFLKLKRVCLDDCPVPDIQIIDVGGCLVFYDGEYVDVMEYRRYDS